MAVVCGIYKITSPTNKCYIGSSIDINKRWQDYKAMDCKKQIKLFNSFKKHGIENHIFEIIEETSFDMLYEKENYYGSFYDCLNGLNCRLPKYGENKNITSVETKEAIKQSRIGKKHTQDTKDKISQSKKGSIPYNKGLGKIKIKLTKEEINEQRRLKMLGHIVSDSTKLKQSLSKKGKPSTSPSKFKKGMIPHNKGKEMPKHIKDALLLANIGRPFTEDHKKKLSEASKNKVWSEESKLKLSNSKKGHVVTDETKEKLRITNLGQISKQKVKIFIILPFQKDILLFDSITEASKILNIKRTSIGNNLRGFSKFVNSNKYGKIKFEYYDCI